MLSISYGLHQVGMQRVVINDIVAIIDVSNMENKTNDTINNIKVRVVISHALELHKQADYFIKSAWDGGSHLVK